MILISEGKKGKSDKKTKPKKPPKALVTRVGWLRWRLLKNAGRTG